MKKIFLLATLICYTTITVLAQHDHSSHQNQTANSKTDTTTRATVIDEISQQQLSQLLSSYYNIKNALVTGNANAAASNADLFLKTATGLDHKVLSEGSVHSLVKDAGKISNSKDLKRQREYFADLSSNMVAVAKSFKRDDQPIYLLYCPMKKAAWLSSEKQVRNPYYGSSMLTCGAVTETL